MRTFGERKYNRRKQGAPKKLKRTYRKVNLSMFIMASTI
jgi:hypothetical protein